MNLVDANVLLYAVDADARHHAASKHWLDGALSGSETISIPWVCALAFVRVATSPRIYPNPLDPDDALAIVEAWWAQPAVVPVEPGPGHIGRLRSLLEATDTGGNLVTDAHLAALAIERRAAVVTFDTDFTRFPGVRIHRPGD